MYDITTSWRFLFRVLNCWTSSLQVRWHMSISCWTRSVTLATLVPRPGEYGMLYTRRIVQNVSKWCFQLVRTICFTNFLMSGILRITFRRESFEMCKYFLKLTFPLWCSIVFVNYYTHYHCELNTEVTILWADASGEICQEKKVLYKLISGLHSSISIHIAADYLLDETKNQVSLHLICSMFLLWFARKWINNTC